MGKLKNFVNKAKGVFGRVANGIAKYAPKVGGVFDRVGDYTGIPLLKWIGKAANTVGGIAGGIAGGLKNNNIGDAVKGAVDKVKSIGPAPNIEGSVSAGKDFINRERDKIKKIALG